MSNDEGRSKYNPVVAGELPVRVEPASPYDVEHVLGAHAKGIGERGYAESAYPKETPQRTSLRHLFSARED